MNIFVRTGRFFTLFVHLFHTMLQMIYGGWKIAKLHGPIITIFGSSRLKKDNIYAKKAHELAQRLIDNDISLLTGGGPGIMEAASCNINLKGKKAKSIGINVRGLEEKPHDCMIEYFELEYFFARKWLLTEYSSGFIIFPGGFGTLDEMAGVLTLIQTKKLKKVPVVLIGVDYWQPFINWIQDTAVAQGAILKEEMTFMFLTDDFDEAFCFLLGKCKVN